MMMIVSDSVTSEVRRHMKRDAARKHTRKIAGVIRAVKRGKLLPIHGLLITRNLISSLMAIQSFVFVTPDRAGSVVSANVKEQAQ
jgi:hypothetical protein